MENAGAPGRSTTPTPPNNSYISMDNRRAPSTPDQIGGSRLSTRQPQRVINADTPRLWNLMWPAAGTPYGSFYFNNEPNQLDQFLVNVNMIHPSGPLHVNPDTVEVLRLPGTVDPGTYPKPRPFGGMGHDIDQTGFSDHFPIGVRVTETPKSVSPSRGRRLRAWADSRLGQEPLQESRAYQAVCS